MCEVDWLLCVEITQLLERSEPLDQIGNQIHLHLKNGMIDMIYDKNVIAGPKVQNQRMASYDSSGIWRDF